ESDITVLSARIIPGQAKVPRQILPAVGISHKSHRAPLPGGRASQRQTYAVALRKQHWMPLVIADPSGIAVPTIHQMRRQQRIAAIAAKLALNWLESNFLQNYVAVRIGEDL